MSKADGYPIPTTSLDREIARIALDKARKIVVEGHTPEEAADVACSGAWAEWRDWILARLREAK